MLFYLLRFVFLIPFGSYYVNRLRKKYVEQIEHLLALQFILPQSRWGRTSDRWNRVLQGYSCRHPTTEIPPSGDEHMERQPFWIYFTLIIQQQFKPNSLTWNCVKMTVVPKRIWTPFGHIYKCVNVTAIEKQNIKPSGICKQSRNSKCFIAVFMTNLFHFL